MFVDRMDAGIRLANALERFRGTDAVLLAIPRGGVPVAAEIVKVLHLPLDILLTKKIGHPDQPELAIGAVSLKGLLLDPRFHVPRTYIDAQVERIRSVLRERETAYRSGRAAIPIKGRTVIIVDDGVATGYTIRAAIELMRQAGAERVVVAVPVAASDALELLRKMADQVICLVAPNDLAAIDAYYDDFKQVSDREVMALLEQSTHGKGAGR